MRTKYRSFAFAVLVVLVVGVTFLTPAPAPAQAPNSPVVVRYYFETQEQLNAVAGQIDTWEAHPDLGYAIAAVTPEQFARLKDLGYRPEVDAAKTEKLGIQAMLDGRFYYFDNYNANPSGLYVKDFLQDTDYVYGNIAELFDVGNAWQADHGGYLRDMWVLRITNEDPAYGDISAKPAFFLFATVHAREVATPELVIRYIKYLTGGFNGQGGYDVDPDVTWLVNHNVLYALVMQNPDGHVVNEINTGNYRRKNMDNDDGCSDPYSWGVDLNRNSSFKWGCCGGSSGQPCSETYRGPTRGSEPETQAFQDFFAQVMQDQNGDNGDDQIPPAAPDNTTGTFLSLHSYGDEVLWPWSFGGSSPNDAQLDTIGRKLAYYTGFFPLQFLYTVDGDNTDWAYGKFGVAAFTYEVGADYGNCGDFFPAYGCIDGIDGMPRNFWNETKPSFLYFSKISRTPYLTSYGPDTQNLAVTPYSVPQGVPTELTGNVADHRYGSDPKTSVAAAEYFVDAPGADGTGTAMSPSDGAWGGLTENVEASVPTGDLSVGKHYILVHGQGTNGKWGPFTAIFVDVTPGVQETMHINKMKINWAYGRPPMIKVVTLVRVYDQDQMPVTGATVFGEWTYPNGQVVPVQGVIPTDTLGRTKFPVKQPQTGTYQFCVTDMTLAGYVYNPADNQDGPCKSVNAGP